MVNAFPSEHQTAPFAAANFLTTELQELSMPSTITYSMVTFFSLAKMVQISYRALVQLRSSQADAFG
jgi:hypothetical protein